MTAGRQGDTDGKPAGALSASLRPAPGWGAGGVTAYVEQGFKGREGFQEGDQEVGGLLAVQH